MRVKSQYKGGSIMGKRRNAKMLSKLCGEQDECIRIRSAYDKETRQYDHVDEYIKELEIRINKYIKCERRRIVYNTIMAIVCIFAVAMLIFT